MAKGLYIGTGDTAKKVKNIYIGVDGVARRVKKGYIGIDGVARLFYENNGGSLNWKSASSPTSGTYQTLLYGNGLFTALSTNGKYNKYSVDAINWTENSISATSSQVMTIYSGAFGSNVFIGRPYASPYYPYSTDGKNWTIKTNGPTGNTGTSMLKYVGNRFLLASAATGISNTIYYSTNGASWSSSNSGVSGVAWGNAAYGNGKYVVVAAKTSTTPYSTTQSFITSTNGTTWTTGSLPVKSMWNGLAYGNGRFVLISSLNYNNGARGYYSSNGTTWTAFTAPFRLNNYNNFLFAKDRFIFIDNTTNLYWQSKDGLTWNSNELPVEDVWASAAYGNGKLVIMSSTTGKILHCSL